MLLWLDDIRVAPDGWIWAKTAEQAIDFLRTGEVTILSLDHDLGENQKTGYDVTLWIEKEVVTNGFNPPEMMIHSANSVGRLNMTRAISSILRFANG